MGREHCGRRRNCSLWSISHFSTVFSKDLDCRNDLKSMIPAGKSCRILLVRIQLNSAKKWINPWLHQINPTIYQEFNPLPNNKFQTLPNWKSLQTTISNLTNGRKLSKRAENTVGKGEIARYEQFLFFPQCFQKAFSQGRQKVSLCGNWLRIVKTESTCWLQNKCG